MRIITVTVPIPHKALSPNARCFWRTKAAAVKVTRTRARLGACAELLCAQPRWTRARTRIRWFTKTIRHPDADNALASLKAAFDGFKDAGLLADDNGLAHEPIEFSKDAKNPRVEITIEPYADGVRSKA